jgi:hypothetical protein
VIRTSIKVTTKVDNTAKVVEALKKLRDLDVLVGIPQEKSSRQGQHITNAELAFLHSKGFKTPKRALFGAYQKRFQSNKRKGKALAAMQAYMMEKGDPYWHVPARPFLEPALKAHMPELEKRLKVVAQLALSGREIEATAKAREVGQLAARYVKEWFVDTRNGWAPNHPLIVALKGSDKPLIDTSVLRNAISFVLQKER